MSGVRPHLKVGEVFTSCVVRSEAVAQFQLGVEYDVTLEILFWDEYGYLFREDMDVELFEGSRLVARGKFLPAAPLHEEGNDSHE
jgi:hypothetical protein